MRFRRIIKVQSNKCRGQKQEGAKWDNYKNIGITTGSASEIKKTYEREDKNDCKRDIKGG